MKQDQTEAKEYQTSPQVAQILIESKGAEQYAKLIRNYFDEMGIDDQVRAEKVLQALRENKPAGNGRIHCDLSMQKL